MKNYQMLFCPDNFYRGKTLPYGAPNRPTYDYVTSYGMTGVVGAINVQTGSNYATWVTRDKAWINQYVPAGTKYDGVAGWADMGGWQTGVKITVAAPSVTLAAVARPAEYVFFYDGGDFDGWHGSFPSSGNVGFGYCGAYLDPSGNPYDYTFEGPSPKHTNSPVNSCDVTDTTGVRGRNFGNGLANVSFMDGHVKGFKGPSLFKLTPDGTHLLYYTITQ